MTTLLVLLACSCTACLFLTPLTRAWAARHGLVDRPDGRRKMHNGAIPAAGGLAILLAVGTAMTATLLASDSFADQLREQGPVWLGLFLAVVVIGGVGLLDDARGLPVQYKLLGQLAAAGIVISSGLVVRKVQLLGWDLELGLLAVPFTAFWLLGAINALNLIDGMDGLLGCVGLLISLALAAAAVLAERWLAAGLAAALAGALLGFLCYNFPPATVFLGNSGSMLIGLAVGVLALAGARDGPATVALAAPLAVLTIPLFDTLAAIVRRKLTGRSILTTDRGHLHHCLLRRGLSSRQVLLWVSLLCVVTGGGALASLAVHNDLFALVTALAVVGFLVATRSFGYAEFLLVQDRLAALAALFWRGREIGRTRELEVHLQGSADWTELWGLLTACAAQLNLKTVRLDVNAPAIHEGYHARWDRLDEPGDGLALWRAEIPLAARGQVVGRLAITGRRDREPVSLKIAALMKLAEDWERAVSALAGAALPTPAVEVDGSPPAGKIEQLTASG